MTKLDIEMRNWDTGNRHWHNLIRALLAWVFDFRFFFSGLFICEAEIENMNGTRYLGIPPITNYCLYILSTCYLPTNNLQTTHLNWPIPLSDRVAALDLGPSLFPVYKLRWIQWGDIDWHENKMLNIQMLSSPRLWLANDPGEIGGDRKQRQEEVRSMRETGEDGDMKTRIQSLHW